MSDAEQPLQALARANEIRLARARLRQAIHDGDGFAASVLIENPRCAETWAVSEMLQAQRRWGPKTTHRLLVRLQIAELKTVGSLTPRQRRVLSEALVNGSPGEGAA